MKTTGVRELRQHASRYLALLAAGETVEVTDRGRPVARLIPIDADPWQRVLSQGAVMPPELDGEVLDEAPADYGVSASERLAAMRADER
jgi:prevent-host-death family protein